MRHFNGTMLHLTSKNIKTTELVLKGVDLAGERSVDNLQIPWILPVMENLKKLELNNFFKYPGLGPKEMFTAFKNSTIVLTLHNSVGKDFTG